MGSILNDGAADTDTDTDAAFPPPQHVQVQLGSAPAADPNNSTLLPAPVANLVSLATRSTGLAIRIGSAVGGFGLGAAKFTTLSSLELSRALLEGIFSRASKDAVSRSDSELARADAESMLARTIEGLHRTMGQIVFWTAASFQTTSTTLSVVSETSQLLLSTIDQFFGSTDSSRAMASIVTMVRREFENPATGMRGETVSVADLVMVLCGIAYLQRSSRYFLEEESRAFRTEEVVWDVVVPNDALPAGIQKRPPMTRRNSVIPSIQTHSTPNSHHRDSMSELELERQIMRSLPPNAKVSITREISTSEIIRVNVISDTRPVRVAPPPGVELIEENWGQPGPEMQYIRLGDHQTTTSSSQFVFRHARRQQKTTSFQKVDGDIHHIAGYMEELGAEPLGSLTLEDDDLISPQPRRPSRNSIAETDFRRLSYAASENSASTTSSTTPSRTPTPTTDDAPIQEAPQYSSQRQLLLTGSQGIQGHGLAPYVEKQTGLRGVLKRSMSMFDKENPGPDVPVRKKRDILANPRRAAKVNAQCEPLRPSTASRSPPSTPGEGTFTPGDTTPDGARTPFRRSHSHASFVSVHEKRHSTISMTETYSITTTDGYRPVSECGEMADDPVVDDTRLEIQPRSPRSPAKTQHRRIKSQNPSIYTLRANRSETSLVSYQAYHQPSAYSAAEALGTLRQRGMLDGMFPKHHLLRNITRYMRFASASYGSRFLKLLGIAKQMPMAGAFDGMHHELRAFAHHTRSDPSCILLSSFVDPQGGSDGTGATNTGVPLVHYISLDHESKAVVLACRGTLGFEDVLTDMTCEYDDLAWRGTSYKVHKGVHASARRLLYGGDGRVLHTLQAALEEFPTYGLVLTGHSLGGAVTSLLGVMLSEPGPGSGNPFVTSAEPHHKLLLPAPSTTTAINGGYPRGHLRGLGHGHVCLPPGRPIHVYAYGPPSTMSPALRAATRGLVTAVVHGNDLVPSLSLGVLHDVQAVALALKSDNNAAKTELRQRIWRAFLAGVGVPVGNHDGGGGGGSADLGGPGAGAAPEEAEDVRWAYATLKVLRASMMGEKLVPPGEVFVVESAGQQARGGTRMVLRYVGDVERRFREVRFGGGMLTDHSPGRYEAALEKLERGVLGGAWGVVGTEMP
ncbi:hypothetical protein BT67DRAFT_478797 [Trichocladium antarcticum]|uniref:sn-1-specific diacylglycerol lipase n=1 Tax=Trichocladium antarcticum TaxID=1450529 RepID=A0AAN6UIP4_9PEZI|nr:hypothetical protein BT67DRAFT_478797 [Trichocladium antarcticum]